MRRLSTLLCSAVLLFFIIHAISSSAHGQVNQYTKDGISFSYPLDWPAQEEGNAQIQMISLDRGLKEAKIMVMAFRHEMTPEQVATVQPTITQSLADSFVEVIERMGGHVQRSSVTTPVGLYTADGVRLQAMIGEEPGTADIYSVVINKHLIYLVFVGPDVARERASIAWGMIRNTLRVGEEPQPLNRIADRARPRLKLAG